MLVENLMVDDPKDMAEQTLMHLEEENLTIVSSESTHLEGEHHTITPNEGIIETLISYETMLKES